MLNARERPRGRNNKDTYVLFDGQFSVHLRKPEIVTDTETKAQLAQGEGLERIARSETLLFFNRRDCVQVGLAIFRTDFSLTINKDQRIVDRSAILLGYAAYNGYGKLRRDFLKP